MLELRLYEGWMAGSPTERCAWNWTEWASPSAVTGPSRCAVTRMTPHQEWFDMLGRPVLLSCRGCGSCAGTTARWSG